MHTGNQIHIIIGIVNIDNIRQAFLETVFLPICNFNVLRIFSPLIMHLAKRFVCLSVKIRDWNYISITAFVFPGRQVNTLKGIPHRCFIGHKNDLLLIRYLPFHILPHCNQLLLSCLICFHAFRPAAKSLGHSENTLAIFLKCLNTGRSQSIYCFYLISHSNSTVLTISQQTDHFFCGNAFQQARQQFIGFLQGI